MRLTQLIGGFMAVALAGTGARGDYYVAQGGQTPGDFLSWATAASNIQDAVTAAPADSTVCVSRRLGRPGGLHQQGARTARRRPA